MRLRLKRIYGLWQTDSNPLAHRRARLDARRAMLIGPAPLAFPLDWLRRRNPVKVVFLAVVMRRQGFQRMVCQ